MHFWKRHLYVVIAQHHDQHTIAGQTKPGEILKHLAKAESSHNARKASRRAVGSKVAASSSARKSRRRR